MGENRLRFGCIADDFTGAGDMASFLSKGGLDTILVSGIPRRQDIPEGAEAVVVSLKSRTAPAAEAVADSIEGIKRMEECGCDKFYIKYCSTFDSTKKGNIGPVLDAALEYLDEEYTLICPSLPVNGRTVQNGELYVNGVPLARSGMKEHPLTPMWDSKIACLMKEQSKYPCVVLERKDYHLSEPEIMTRVRKQIGASKHFYLIPDYETEEDAEAIVEHFGDRRLITGGSGLALTYAKKLSDRSGRITEKHSPQSTVNCGAVLIVGSVSQATLNQVEWYMEQGLPYYKVEPELLGRQEITADKIWAAVKTEVTEHKNNVLIFCTGSRADLEKGKQYGRHKFAEQLENLLAEVAYLAVDGGVCRVIVAGGETSGAVTTRLGYKNFYVGESVAPGVPVLIPINDSKVRLVLKSGNFGQTDFFIRACQLTEKNNGEDLCT